MWLGVNIPTEELSHDMGNHILWDLEYLYVSHSIRNLDFSSNHLSSHMACDDDRAHGRRDDHHGVLRGDLHFYDFLSKRSRTFMDYRSAFTTSKVFGK